MATKRTESAARHAMLGWCIDKNHKKCPGTLNSIYPVHCTCKCHKACGC